MVVQVIKTNDKKAVNVIKKTVLTSPLVNQHRSSGGNFVVCLLKTSTSLPQPISSLGAYMSYYCHHLSEMGAMMPRGRSMTAETTDWQQWSHTMC